MSDPKINTENFFLEGPKFFLPMSLLWLHSYTYFVNTLFPTLAAAFIQEFYQVPGKRWCVVGQNLLHLILIFFISVTKNISERSQSLVCSINQSTSPMKQSHIKDGVMEWLFSS